MRRQTKKCWAMLAVVMLAGCHKVVESQLIGKWKVDASSITAPPVPSSDPQQNKMMLAMVKNIASKFSIDFKADKTFAMNMILAYKGTWAIEGANVVLTITQAGNAEVSQSPPGNGNREPMIFQFDASNSRLVIQNANKKDNSMRKLAFVKE